MSNQPWNAGQPPQGGQAWQQTPPPRRGGGLKVALLVVAIIVAGALIGVAAYLLTRPGPGPDDPTPGTSSPATSPASTTPSVDPDSFPEVVADDAPAQIGDWVAFDLEGKKGAAYTNPNDDLVSVITARMTWEMARSTLVESTEETFGEVLCGREELGMLYCFQPSPKFGVLWASTYDEVSFEEMATILEAVNAANP